MLTFEGESCRIHYNGDYSGNIEIVTKNEEGESVCTEVSMDDITEFVAEAIKSEVIAKIESSEPKDFLHNIIDHMKY